MQTISIIAAMGKNRELGYQGKMPWHLPADLAHFKELTSGHAIVMGRKTYESIGRPLPNRRNIIITRQQDYQAEGCEVVGSLEEALNIAGDREIFIVGGAEIYREAFPIVSKMYLTYVDGEFTADAYFPEWKQEDWQERERAAGVVDENNSVHHTFAVLQRK